MATTAIAILNFNGQKHLAMFLPTLIKHSGNTPIYIGDNASTDDSVEFIKKKFSQVHLIELKENYGYSKGYNQLLKHISFDYVALVNSDIEVTNNWLTPLIAVLESNTQIAAVQPKIKSFHTKTHFEYAGAAGGFIDTYGYPFCRGRLFDTLEEDQGQYDTNIQITWASGACFLVRKSLFDKVGGFDDDFFAHMEEIDLGWRFINNGYKINYTYQSTVYHVGGGTLAYESAFKTYLNFRNGLYLLIKNLPKAQLRKKLAIRILLDWLSALYFLVQGKWKQSIAVLKAHKKVFLTTSYFKKKRQEPITKSSLLKPYSIVWKYFVKGIKKYSNLNNS